MRKPDLSKLSLTGGTGVPTMIVPPGTQIAVDAEGQVSIRTPGNLVLQNSGAYSTLESVSGSIRVEPNVKVEANTVRCADTCLVQGSLVAWRVVARTLHVDGDGEAQVVMQETERLEVGKNGRLVGNFRSEKELFDLFSRFAGQVRALPAPPMGGTGNGAPVEATVVAADEAEPEPEPEPESVVEEAEVVASPAPEPAPELASPKPSPPPQTAAPAEEPDDLDEIGEPPRAARVTRSELPDALCVALVLLEQEQESPRFTGARRRALDKLVHLLRDGDLDTLRHTYKTLFARIADGAEAVKRARQAAGSYFDARPE